jgi:hypothetical protein
MGIPTGEVHTRLISLHQKGELNGTADRSAAGPSDRSFGNSSGKSPTLTKKDLEDFERAEAEARNGTGTPSQTGTPFKAFSTASGTKSECVTEDPTDSSRTAGSASPGNSCLPAGSSARKA